MPMPRRSFQDRVEKGVDRSGGPNACWPWTDGLNPKTGHGSFGWTPAKGERRKRTGAHRAAWMHWVGPIPEGMQVNHTCNNPPCCNPAHLYLGNQVQNMRDRLTTGAGYLYGEDHLNAIIPNEVVSAIRSEYQKGVHGAGQWPLARKYGISRAQVQRIVTGASRVREVTSSD